MAEGRLHWSEVQVGYGSLRHNPARRRDRKPTGRGYTICYKRFRYGAGIVELEVGNLSFSSRSDGIVKKDHYREA
jgi:hypothetical protein